MPFGIDDVAVAAFSEALKEGASEALKGVSEEIASQEFGEEAFKESLDHNPSEMHGNNYRVKFSSDVREVVEEEFSPTRFMDLGIEKISEFFNSDVSSIAEDSVQEIEHEFSPENFNQHHIEDHSQNFTDEVKQVERTSTFEEQTIDNFKLESMRPDVEENLNLGQDHDGGVLRYNMEQVMEVSYDTEVSNAHHIVGRDTPQAAKKLEEFGIDRNDPANGILLPNSPESPLKGAVHGQGRHSMDYSNEVEQRFAGVTSREEALEVLQSIKEDLYSGDLYVHKDIPANK